MLGKKFLLKPIAYISLLALTGPLKIEKGSIENNENDKHYEKINAKRRPSELPIYRPLRLPRERKVLSEVNSYNLKDDLEAMVRAARIEVGSVHLFKSVRERKDQIVGMVQRAKNDTRNAVIYVHSPEHYVTRLAVITMGSALGYSFAFRKSLPKKVFYTALGTDLFASWFYPSQTALLAKLCYKEIYSAFKFAYDFLSSDSLIEDSGDVFYGTSITGKDADSSKKKSPNPPNTLDLADSESSGEEFAGLFHHKDSTAESPKSTKESDYEPSIVQFYDSSYVVDKRPSSIFVDTDHEKLHQEGKDEQDNDFKYGSSVDLANTESGFIENMKQRMNLLYKDTKELLFPRKS